ncbi:MAG: phosphate ABC transporter substrate-binding protein [Dehalobacter sp. 4CP]|nr:phosphate ABC transporter substrate-binding protein [Dehalobacter sp. 4CP]
MMKNVKLSPILALILVCTLALSALLASGCGASSQSSQNGETTSKSGLKGELTISGSTSMEEVNNALADAFMAKNPDVKINVQALGSSQGIQAVSEGSAQIGASSRALKDDEKTKTPDLKEIAIAMDGIAVVINPANAIADLKTDDIKKIYTGEISNWKDLGGSDTPITVVRREDGSGTLDAFSELIMGGKTRDIKYVSSAVIQNSTGAVMSSVAGDPGAIGFASMGAVDSKLKAVKVDGIAATPGNVLNKTYRAQRPFVYVTKGDAAGLTKAFIDFALSAEGQKAVSEAKAIPLNK